ncbi:SGNH/GDSL hydrolase family protein [Intrasporangium mesophilum]
MSTLASLRASDRMVPVVSRFVALGDSLTEGVGDPHPSCPNGFRGWADIVAARLAVREPSTEYANLALRAKRTVDLAAEQVEPAIAMRPDVVTIWAGGNDLLRPVLRRDEVLDPLEDAVCRVAGTTAHVVLLTGWAPIVSLVLRPVRARVSMFDNGIREIARRHGATLLDLASLADWNHPALWSADRVHPSPGGHARIADAVGQLLGLAPSAGVAAPRLHGAAPRLRDGIPAQRAGYAQWWHDERAWWLDHAAPHVRRWVARTSSREQVQPKWAVPVRPATAFAWREGAEAVHEPADVA